MKPSVLLSYDVFCKEILPNVYVKLVSFGAMFCILDFQSLLFDSLKECVVDTYFQM